MVRGITRQVVVFRPKNKELFEKAVLFLREDSLEKHGIGEQELLEEARSIADACKVSRRRRRYAPLLWGASGAALTGLVWILTLLL